MKDQQDANSGSMDPVVLAERIGQGQREAEAELVRRYSRPLMTMLRQRTGDEQRAEDVHQDTFCIVLERLRTRGIDDPSRLAAFIHRTAVNVLIGDVRKEARRQTYADTDTIQRVRDSEPDHLQRLISRESGNAVRETVLELQNTRDRELLYRYYILQQEKPIVCKALELTPEHFDRVIYRAKQRFKKIIQQRQLMPIDAGGAT